MEHKVIVHITSHQIDDIMASALGSSGIWNWANDAVVFKTRRRNPPAKTLITEALTTGLSIRIREVDTGKWHYLTLKKFLKGMSYALAHGFDLENFDGPSADTVIQAALFGEEVYS